MKRSLIALLAAAALAAPAPALAQMHAPAPMTQAQFESAPTGSNVQLMVRVVSLKRDTLHADLLAQVDSSHYKTTGTQVDLYFPADTPLMMGGSADVKPGAVLYVYAVATMRDRADVKRAVVVTPYATVSS